MVWNTLINDVRSFPYGLRKGEQGERAFYFCFGYSFYLKSMPFCCKGIETPSQNEQFHPEGSLGRNRSRKILWIPIRSQFDSQYTCYSFCKIYTFFCILGFTLIISGIQLVGCSDKNFLRNHSCFVQFAFYSPTQHRRKHTCAHTLLTEQK